VKHAFSVIGGVVAVLMLTSRSFARQAHLTHGKEYYAAAAVVVVFHLIGAGVARALRPKPPATPSRPAAPYSAGTRR
jgi:hypothetical protein